MPFLKEKSIGNKEGLKKHIKAAKRYWMTYVELSKESLMDRITGSWGQRGDALQHKIITLSAIALLDKTDINTWDEVFHLLEETSHDTILLETLKWAKPNWIDIFLLEKIKKQEWLFFDYRGLRFLEDNQLINYNPELFALCICIYRLYSADTKQAKNKKTLDYINFLTTDSIAYQRDILELFNYETNLNSHTFNDILGYNETNRPLIDTIIVWEKVFNQLLADNKLDRTFFIEQCLQIQTKEWNNNLKSFFRKRLEDLTF